MNETYFGIWRTSLVQMLIYCKHKPSAGNRIALDTGDNRSLSLYFLKKSSYLGIFQTQIGVLASYSLYRALFPGWTLKTDYVCYLRLSIIYTYYIGKNQN